MKVQHRRKHDWHFDPNKERRLIMEREGKNVALYLSSAGEEDMHRTSPRMLKSAKTFHHAFHSVKIPSRNSKLRKSSDSMQKGAFDMIERSDSLGLKEDPAVNQGEEEDLTISQNQDDLFKSAQPILFRPADSAVYRTYSPERSPLIDSTPGESSPMKLLSKNSVVAV